MSAPSTNAADYVDFLVSLLQDQSALKLNDKNVMYGDQEMIPFTPFVCVEAGVTRREYNGTQRRVMCEINTHILIYFSKLTKSSDNLRDSDNMAHAITTLVHANNQFGGLCIDSHVSAIEHGYQKRQTSIFRTSMLTVEARQQELLPLNP